MTMKFNPLPCVMCVILWTVGWSESSPNGDSGERNCHRVQREFFHKRIGTSDIVPDNPIHDAAVSICFNAAKEKDRKSCCSRQSELKYLTASEKYLKNSIRTKNALLKKLVMDHISTYQERILGLLQVSENSTRHVLSDVYHIPRDEYHQTVHDFYREIKQYMKQKHVSVYGSVAEFFDRIFPAVYKYTLSDGNVIELTEEHRNCLKSKRQEISPAPFGLLPFNMSHNLHKVLSIAKSYLDVLSLIVEAINTTDHLAINEKCKEQLTQLQFCSHCDGYVDVKPCKGFCLNVMRGCLAQLSMLTTDWKGLVTAVARLEGGMSRNYDIEKILGNINQRIDGAVMYAMESQHKYYRSMKDLCDFKVQTKSADQPKSESSSGGNHGNKHHRHHQAPLNKRSLTSDGDYLYNQFLEVMKELLSSLNMYDSISSDICDQELFYNQDMHNGTCWNGTTIGKYTPMVEGLSSFSKAVNIEMDPKIATLREKLSQMKINLVTKYSDRDDLMFSDSEPVVNYGSGDRLPWNKQTLAQSSDDEDLYGSGAGSGGYNVEGSGNKDNSDGQTPVIKPHVTTKSDDIGFTQHPSAGKPRSSADHVIATTLTTMFITIGTIVLL